MTGEPAFVELGVEDVERARRFYGGLLGWSFSPGPSPGGYLVATSGVPAGLHGGDPGASPSVFFRVDDLDAATERVRELGGTVEPLEDDHADDRADAGADGGADGNGDGSAERSAPLGRFVLCRDDQGSPFGLVQPPA